MLHRAKSSLASVATLSAALAFASPASADFTTSGKAIVRGGYEVTGNALMRCPTGTTCVNNNVALVPVDVDPIALGDLDGNGTDDTTMSASGTLTVPVGATIVSATLYYSATGAEVSGTFTGAPWIPTAVANAPLLFGKTGGSYTKVIPESLVGEDGLLFQGRYNVTSLVTGSGEYWVANGITAPATHQYSRDALFVLVVLFDDGSTARLIQTYDGVYHCGDSTSTLTLDGFRTPATGAVDAKFSIWGQDGNPSVTGESIMFGSTLLSNALNSSNNVGNGTMSTASGVALTRNPSVKVHAEPPDLDTFDASSAVTNGQSTAAIELKCGATDGVFWLGSVLSIAIVAPELSVTKTATDVNRGSLVPGDEIRYEIAIANTAGDDAIDVDLTDAIPANTTFVPGSIEIETGGAFVAKTDSAGDDEAELSGTNLVVRVGSGATTTTGGSIAVGATAKVRFRVTVGNLAAPTMISNRATVRARASSGGSTSAFLAVQSNDGAGSGATAIAAVPCVVDSNATIDPGCRADAPACKAEGASAHCIVCIETRHCATGSTCIGGACVVPTPSPTPDSGVTMPSAAPTAAVPKDDAGCSCRAAGGGGSPGGMLAGLGALLAAAVAWRGRRRSS